MLSSWLQEGGNAKFLTYGFLACIGIFGLCLSILIDNQDKFKFFLRVLIKAYFALNIILLCLWMLGLISVWWCVIFVFVSALEWLNITIESNTGYYYSIFFLYVDSSPPWNKTFIISLISNIYILLLIFYFSVLTAVRG